MRRLAVFLMIPALVFLTAAMASARGWGAIHGNYEMVATGNCLHDKSAATEPGGGFTFSGTGTLIDPYTATPKSADYFISTYMGEGTWTFFSDGTGMMQVMQYCILPPYTGSPGSPKPKVTQAFVPSFPQPWPEAVPFTYEVDGSAIKVTIPPPIKLTLVGKISRDHKTMTLQSAMPVPEQGTQYNGLIGYWQICTVTRTLTRIIEVDD